MTTRLSRAAWSCSGKQGAVPEGPFLDQPDCCHFRHSLRYVYLVRGEGLICAAEQVQGADDVRAYS